jgi:uncharacterized protein (TIGR02246 family)
MTSACVHVRVRSGAPDVSSDTQHKLSVAMHESAAAWNRGDLDAFLAVYKDESLTAFMAPQITYGLQEIRARYARSYFKDGKPKGDLSYDDLKLRALGEDYVLMTGKWHLVDRETGKKQDGYYTLLWERTSSGWKIIHDHST